MSKIQNNETIELVKEDGTKFTARFAPFTSSRMDLVLPLLGDVKDKDGTVTAYGYTDMGKRAEDIISMYEMNPAIIESPEFLALTALFAKFAKGELKREELHGKVVKILSTSVTYEAKRRNLEILNTIVRIMILETTLSEEELKLVKSDTFWGNQDSQLMRETGENFRKKAIQLSE